MTYKELIAKLVEVEAKTGLYLSDPCVDLQNASSPCDDSLFSAAANAAGERAEEAGYNINKLLGFNIY